jgi:hypothetical protein
MKKYVNNTVPTLLSSNAHVTVLKSMECEGDILMTEAPSFSGNQTSLNPGLAFVAGSALMGHRSKKCSFFINKCLPSH